MTVVVKAFAIVNWVYVDAFMDSAVGVIYLNFFPLHCFDIFFTQVEAWNFADGYLVHICNTIRF